MDKTDFDILWGWYEQILEPTVIYKLVHKDDFYECFSVKCQSISIKVLEPFTKIAYKDIYTKKYFNENIKELNFKDTFLNSKLIKYEQEKLYFYKSLREVIFYLIISKLGKGIEQFLNVLNVLNKNEEYFNSNGNFIKLSSKLLDKSRSQFEEVENYQLIFHLFTENISDIIIKNDEQIVKIQISRIKELLNTAQNYNFQNLDQF